MEKSKTYSNLFPDLNWKWEIIGNEKKSIATTKEIKRSCVSKERLREALEDEFQYTRVAETRKVLNRLIKKFELEDEKEN